MSPSPKFEVADLTVDRSVDLACSYRFQSFRSAEPGYLRGAIAKSSHILSSHAINAALARFEKWDGHSTTSLEVFVAEERGGVFARNSDALYHSSHFSNVVGTPVPNDLVDIHKLQELFRVRLPHLERIFSRDSFEYLSHAMTNVVVAACNEYMCHEGGHCLGYSVAEKLHDDFFRVEGRLVWPLVYLEEYRADVNSWAVAISLLKPEYARDVILYTLAHRLGAASQNLRDGAGGVGYVPYLHFAGLMSAGFLLVEPSSSPRSGTRIAFPTDTEAILQAARTVCDSVLQEIDQLDNRDDPGSGVEAMLAFGAKRLSNKEWIADFMDIVQGPPNLQLPTNDGDHW